MELVTNEQSIVILLFDDKIRQRAISKMKPLWFQDELYRALCRYFKELKSSSIDDIDTVRRKLREYFRFSDNDNLRFESIYLSYKDYKTTDVEGSLAILLKNIQSLALTSVTLDSFAASEGRIIAESKTLDEFQDILNIQFIEDDYYYNFSKDEDVSKIVSSISTGKVIKSIVDAVNYNTDCGGFTTGDLIMYCGATGIGKTLILMSEAINASKQGFKVLYTALGDMTPIKLYKRFMGIIHTVDKETLNLFFNEYRFDSKTLAIAENIDWVVRKSNMITSKDFVSEVNQRRKHTDYGLVILDYDSNLLTKNLDLFTEYGEVYSDFKGLAQSGTVMMTASQVTKECQSLERMPKECPAESTMKNRHADFQINLGRNKDFRSLATIEVIKNRDGESGVIQRASINGVNIKCITEREYYQISEDLKLRGSDRGWVK